MRFRVNFFFFNVQQYATSRVKAKQSKTILYVVSIQSKVNFQLHSFIKPLRNNEIFNWNQE